MLFPQVERGRLVQQLEHAKTYAEWSRAAQRLDELDGNAPLRLKHTREDGEYDKAMIEEMIREMKTNLRSNDTENLCRIVEVCCIRNFAGTLNPSLYSFLYFGTKQKIEEFYLLLEECITRIANFDDTRLSKEEVEERKKILLHIRSRLGNSALLLSGGASLGMLHIGVTKGLLENSLLPMILHGTSAGSIIAAIIGVKSDNEIEDTLKLTNLELGAFEEYDTGDNSFLQRAIKRLRRFVATGAIYDSETIVKCMRHNLGDATFKEAFERTGRILNIAVSSLSGYEMPKMLNHVTAPDVVVWSAVVASCAIPKIFSSAVILAKCRTTQRLIPWHSTFHENIDGSMENDLPVRSLTEMLNVNFFIVSQVNIHIAPFLFNDLKMNWKQRMAKRSLQFIKKELLFRIRQMENLGLSPKWLSLFYKILSQQYHGDVTIVPKFLMNDYFSLFTNPSPSFVRDCVARGEKALWPNLVLIKNAIRIEKLLDQVIRSF